MSRHAHSVKWVGMSFVHYNTLHLPRDTMATALEILARLRGNAAKRAQDNTSHYLPTSVAVVEVAKAPVQVDVPEKVNPVGIEPTAELNGEETTAHGILTHFLPHVTQDVFDQFYEDLNRACAVTAQSMQKTIEKIIGTELPSSLEVMELFVLHNRLAFALGFKFAMDIHRDVDMSSAG